MRPGLKPILFWILAALLILAIGVLDLATGTDISLSLLYLIPIVLVALRTSSLAAVLLALLAASVWFSAALIGRGAHMWPVVVWNSAARLLFFIGAAVLVARWAADRRKLLALLARESRDARSDLLTGLPNWRGFEENLRREIARSQRSGQPLCLGYLDLDNFKQVNDRHGHAAGDRCLRLVAEGFAAVLRPEDLLARLGGDEFIFLFASPDEASAERIGWRLIDQVNQVSAGFAGAGLSASLGIVFFESHEEDVDRLVKIADNLMYQVKQAGKGSVRIVRHRQGDPTGPPQAEGGSIT